MKIFGFYQSGSRVLTAHSDIQSDSCIEVCACNVDIPGHVKTS